MFNFKNKVAIVTGAASGIGRATAELLAKHGAKVIIADIQEQKCKEVAEFICEEGGEAVAIPCDVTVSIEVKKMVEKAVLLFGGLHIAVNSAGIEGVHAGTTGHTEEMWDKIIDVDLKSVWLSMKYELLEIEKQKEGCIVNVSSAAGLVAGAGTIAYTASKHGVIGLTKSAALEYASKGIRINAVCPGFVRTPMLEKLIDSYPEIQNQLASREPMKRLATVEEIAHAICYLCSDAASFVTGVSMPVDGGFTLWGI